MAVAILVITLTTHARAANVAVWTQYQGNAGHTGYVPGNGLPASTAPTWSFETVRFFDPTPALQFAPGVASDGKNVFLSWVGQSEGVNGMNALDIETGAEQWEWIFVGNDSETVSQPAYSNGKVYVHRWGHSSSCGVTCHDKPRLLGIDASTGMQLFDKVHSGQWSSGGAPAAEGGNVFVAGGYYGGLDNYNGTTGAIVWFAGMPQTYGWVPAADSNHVYTSFGGDLTVVNRATGTSRNLIAPHGAGSYADPVVAGPNEVYAASSRTVTQFDPINGYPTWDYQRTSGVVRQGLALGPTSLYVNFDNVLVALSRSTGQELWTLPVPSGRFMRNLVLTDTHLFVGSETETFAFNLESRQLDWSAPYSGTVAISGNHLFISNSQVLHAFALQNAIPEPTALVHFVVGVAVLTYCRRRS
jgi:hypothetical protein